MKTVASSLRKKKEVSEIDLTPMLDVVFILLIFFVVTASFTKDSALDVQGQSPNSTSNTPPDPTKRNVLIQIDSRNQIFLNQERIDVAAVRARVAQLRAENPAASVIIRPDKASVANTLVNVMNQAREAGATTISVAQ